MTSKTIVMTYVHERLHTIVLLLLLLAFTAPVSSNCNILSANLTKKVERQYSKEGENLIFSSSLKRKENRKMFDFSF